MEAAKKKEVLFTVLAIAVLLIVLIVLEQVLPTTHILFTVLRKGAIYALVAVSINLLNGSVCIAVFPYVLAGNKRASTFSHQQYLSFLIRPKPASF